MSALYLLASAVWWLAPIVDRFSPSTARRMDQWAMNIEDAAEDRERR